MNDEKDVINSLIDDIKNFIIGIVFYGIGLLAVVSLVSIATNLSLVLYSIYGICGIIMAYFGINEIKDDINLYKIYKKNNKQYEHFSIDKQEYEKRLRYQIDRKKDCKIEDFYKEPSSYPTNFVYEKEEKDVTLTKKYR